MAILINQNDRQSVVSAKHGIQSARGLRRNAKAGITQRIWTGYRKITEDCFSWHAMLPCKRHCSSWISGRDQRIKSHFGDPRQHASSPLAVFPSCTICPGPMKWRAYPNGKFLPGDVITDDNLMKAYKAAVRHLTIVLCRYRARMANRRPTISTTAHWLVYILGHGFTICRAVNLTSVHWLLY